MHRIKYIYLILFKILNMFKLGLIEIIVFAVLVTVIYFVVKFLLRFIKSYK